MSSVSLRLPIPIGSYVANGSAECSSAGGLALTLAAYPALYARVVGYDFVWDDVLEIEHNTAFSGSLLDRLAMPQTERPDPELTQLTSIQLAYDSYRPLLFASYWIDIRLWGAPPVRCMR